MSFFSLRVSFRHPLLNPLLVALLLVALSSAPVSAQPFIKGVRVSTTSVDTDGGQLKVNVVVSQFTSSGSNSSSPLGYPGESDIAWGDGVTSSFAYVYDDSSGQYATATDTGNPVYRFRGSFSHTYPDLAPRTIQVHSKCCSITQTLSTIATTVQRRYSYYQSSRASASGTFNRTASSAFSTTFYRGNHPFHYNASAVLGSDFGTVTGDIQLPLQSSTTSAPASQSPFVSTLSTGIFLGAEPSYYRHYTSYNRYDYLDVTYKAKARGFTYTLFLDVIFGDGFESGDANDWS